MQRILSLILTLLVVSALVATGCSGTGGTQPPGPVQPAMCTLRGSVDFSIRVGIRLGERDEHRCIP